MRKQIALWGICIILPLLIGLIWRNEYIKYQDYVNESSLNGTILTWKSGENFDGNHLILLNPNEVSDYVEFDFSFVKKYTGVGYIDSIFFDGNGFYVVATESEKNQQVKLFYVSPVGINQIAENLSCLNWAFSGFIKSGNTLFLKLDQKLYEIDDITKTLRLVKDFGLNKVRAYPYKNGIVYQYNNEVRAYSESGDILLFYLPDNIRFDGWYDVGQSILVSTPNRETYIMDLATGALKLFSRFSFVNYGNSRNGVLLELMPKGGGGATPFDTDYTWSYLLGNDVFTAFTVSIYNVDTGKIANFYYSNNDVTSAWLDVPYDRNRFEKLKETLIKSQSQILRFNQRFSK